MLLALHPNTFMARLRGREDRAVAAQPRVTRLLAVGVRDGATRELPRVHPGRMVVHCRQGEAWITHDGDPRDVVLQANQSYAVDNAHRMTVHALRGDCGLELQFDEG
jgi:hypothetical protein